VSGDSPSNGAAFVAGAAVASVLAAESALTSEPAWVEGGGAGAALSAVPADWAVSCEASLDSVAPPGSAYSRENGGQTQRSVDHRKHHNSVEHK
jgi:hypothetical protein